MDDTRQKAKRLGMTPSQFVRMRLCETSSAALTDGREKDYIVTMENWESFEIYVNAKGLTAQSFLRLAANSEMKKHPVKHLLKPGDGCLVAK
jgi:hypothetical protein